MKKIFFLSFISAFLIVTSCHSLDSNVRVATYVPNTVILGKVTLRNFSYDPFYTKNYKDLLAYEFFKKKYTVIKNDKSIKDYGRNNKINSNSILIDTTIFQYSYGNLLDEKFNTSIIVEVYDSNHVKIFKLVYRADESLENLSHMKKVTNRIAKKVHTKIKRSNNWYRFKNYMNEKIHGSASTSENIPSPQTESDSDNSEDQSSTEETIIDDSN